MVMENCPSGLLFSAAAPSYGCRQAAFGQTDSDFGAGGYVGAAQLGELPGNPFEAAAAVREL
jgi:hypothetical protein